MKTINLFIAFAIACTFYGCVEDPLFDQLDEESYSGTRATPVAYLDWEADYLPTPPTQRINSPWSGDGSIARDFDTDILLDRKPADGWELLFHTFSSEGAELQNPYFILYNKYRGIMRVYYYLTSTSVRPSSNMTSGIYINTSSPSTVLSHLGSTLINNDQKVTSYKALVPSPSTSSPLAPNTWYMVEYEMAYDPNITNYTTDQLIMGFTWEFNNIIKMSLNGTQTGKLYGYVGSNQSSPFLSALGNLGTAVGTGVLSAYGVNWISSSENNLGLSPNVYEKIKSGAEKALESSVQSLPGAAMGLLSAIVGGSSGPKPISLTMDTEIRMEGELTESGSLPGFSVMVPGTNVTSNYTGLVPFYNEPLGVIGVTETPFINYIRRFNYVEYLDPQYGNEWFYDYTRYLYFPEYVDITDCIAINPKVSAVADVEILGQEIVLTYNSLISGPDTLINSIISIDPPKAQRIEEIEYSLRGGGNPPTEWGGALNFPEYSFSDISVRLNIAVTPKDGGETAFLFKTIKACQGGSPKLSGPTSIKSGSTAKIKITNITNFDPFTTTWTCTNGTLSNTNQFDCTVRPTGTGNVMVTAELKNRYNFLLGTYSISIPVTN